MPEGNEADLEIEGWLAIAQITQINEWDVLVFLYRHGTSLASAAQLTSLVGYDLKTVGKALDSLVALGLVKRSRSSKGVRLYRFALPTDPIRHESIEKLLKLSEKRSGRLTVVSGLRRRAFITPPPKRAGLHLA